MAEKNKEEATTTTGQNASLSIVESGQDGDRNNETNGGGGGGDGGDENAPTIRIINSSSGGGGDDHEEEEEENHAWIYTEVAASSSQGHSQQVASSSSSSSTSATATATATATTHSSRGRNLVDIDAAIDAAAAADATAAAVPDWASPPPPPPPQRVVSILAASSPRMSTSSNSRRPSTLRTIPSGRSLHSEESKSNLLAAAALRGGGGTLAAASTTRTTTTTAAASAATTAATQNTSNVTTFSNSMSNSGGIISSSSASFKNKPAYRNFLQRTQAVVRPRYNNSNGGNNNNVAASYPSRDVPLQQQQHQHRHHGLHAASAAAASGGGGAAAAAATFASTNFPAVGGHYQQHQHQHAHHHTTSNSKAALLASRLARRGQVLKQRMLSVTCDDANDAELFFHSAAAAVGIGTTSGGGGGAGGTMDSSLLSSPAGVIGGGGGGGGTATGSGMGALSMNTMTGTGLQRQHKMGDQVLVCNHPISRYANLVNRHGFPPREGATPEERRGPYLYVLATVKSVHFEEYSVYYTVVRADTGSEQRADFMEPLTSNPRGRMAALRAATQPLESDNPNNPDDHVPQEGDYAQSKCMVILEEICFVLLCPFLWTWDLIHFIFVSYLCPLGRITLRFLTGQSRLFLNGMEPYSCRLRCTAVNLCVFCSTWYMFIDQARLAFFPASADHALAVINVIVWLILIVELFCEVFIRADNYGELIVSEKAYSPKTVRYINSFHLIVESVSLALFIPEFICLFSSRCACDDRLPFSFYNAALMSVTGPTQVQAFYGKAFFALIRLRVVGVVRHWKTMWIVNNFIHMKWKANKGGLIANIIPTRASLASRKNSVLNGNNQKNGSTSGGNGTSLYGNGSDPNDDEAALTSASTIGTALMVTNSYRALAILWVITGLFPLISCLMPTNTNAVAQTLTKQLQATNLISNDTSNETCAFLTDSVISWANAMRAPDFDEEPWDPYLLGLQIEPFRCFGSGEDILDHMCRQALDAAHSGSLHVMSANETKNVGSDYIAFELCHAYQRIQGSSISELAHELGLRPGSILQVHQQDEALLYSSNGSDAAIGFLTNFSVLVTFDQTYTIKAAATQSFILQLVLLVSVLGGLSVLRRDAEVLVLGPLRRMLKIVARYAKNPLMPTKFKRRKRPLASSINKRKLHSRHSMSGGDSHSDASSCGSSSDDSDSDDQGSNDALGSYETEQLITAVTKITDLLRKCWGVAGADIISTNLDSQEGLKQVFNPTVAGKKVYALFAFAAITDFAHAQRTLGGNVMILINHVAGVVHDEVFRWGFGDSGACNKNLGAAFLLVFRIGLVSEVQNKLKQAKDVIFNHGPKASQVTKRPKKVTSMGSTDYGSSTTALSHSSSSTTSLSVNFKSRSSLIRNSNSLGGKAVGASPTHARRKSIAASSSKRACVVSSSSEKAMSLASLPGINAFTDRAVIGMLKSFAGIHRDKKIRDWNNIFELSAGVGTFTVSMIYGMDAGWAMEGAVGSEYKIDATYLSPHVNMASRMMSACKQYGVSILLSQAVQELMSDVARSKLRHLDTVTVKGSSMKQKIYTYDARHKAVDFFLYSKTDAQADEDANKYYETKIWNMDQDLKAMRQHVTEDFLKEFGSGRKAYLSGDWPEAMKRLERANEIMVETALEEGYLEDEFNAVLQYRAGDDARAAAEELKVKNGDGPSLYLLNFMKSHGGVAPERWEGWHPLMRK